jgi:cell division transport system permease protein
VRRRLIYFCAQALSSVRESPAVSVLTSLTIGAALLVLACYVTALDNLEGLALVWGRSASLALNLADDSTPTDWDEVRQKVVARAEVLHAELVTPKAALERFRARGVEAAALVEGVEPGVLPASIEITLRPNFTDLTALEALATELQRVPHVASADYGREEFERLRALLELLRYGGLCGGIFIALATAFIVSNTIRLTVFARRDEITILRLVGATPWFIRTPFLIEGALWGLGGALLATLLLAAGDVWLAPRLSLALADVLGALEVRLWTSDVALGVVGAGVLLGVLGSALAVRRFIDEEPA